MHMMNLVERKLFQRVLLTLGVDRNPFFQSTPSVCNPRDAASTGATTLFSRVAFSLACALPFSSLSLP